MKKYCFHLILFIFIQIGIGLGIFLMTRIHQDHYLQAFSKKREFALQTQGARLFFIGGSNLAFGMDCEKIASDFPDITPVNLGLHAAFGFPFMLNSAAPLVREGDQIILCPEYEHYQAIVLHDVFFSLLSSHPELIRHVDWETARALLDKGLFFMHFRMETLVQRAKHGVWIAPILPPHPYKCSSFNKYGDAIAHWNMAPPDHKGNAQFIRLTPVACNPEYMTGAIKRINEFSREVKERGANVVLTFPPIPQERYDISKNNLAKIKQKLHNELRIGILGNPEDFVYPENHFFDTRYHLTSTGVQKRTAKVIELIFQNEALYHALGGKVKPDESVSRSDAKPDTAIESVREKSKYRGHAMK